MKLPEKTVAAMAAHNAQAAGAAAAAVANVKPTLAAVPDGEAEFVVWVTELAQHAEALKEFRFAFGAPFDSSAETTRIPVWPTWNNVAFGGNTAFTFHYHPHASKSSIKTGAYASDGHFKPSDASDSHMRQFDCNETVKTYLRQLAVAIAKEHRQAKAKQAALNK
ncbi:MAG: hypothetical protein HYX47_14540 [Burkholderiales bacterium]|nr:hypothetical protein [Burkholderiales bacterium]